MPLPLREKELHEPKAAAAACPFDLLPEIRTKLNMISYGGKGKKDAEEQAQ
jgi:hypothetical protein